jgi:hypothetical protein
MTVAITITIAFLPVYLLIRFAFARLPLHIDTGFYVSNSTVATRKIRFAKGWNAHFAGCSKVIPELFYSAIYLLHTRRAGDNNLARWGFKRWSRLYASLLNYATAIAVGYLAFLLSDGDWRLFTCATIVYALLSSEPHWGSYFECGELFENLANVTAILCLMVGLERGELAWFGYAAFAWSFATFFVKLSSAIGFVAVFGGCSILYPTTIPAILIGGGVSTLLYLAWLIVNGQHPIALVRSLVGHESSYDQWQGSWGILHRWVEKGRCLANAAWRNPMIPALAVAGAIFAAPSEPVFWLFALGVTVTYLAQATDCRYYLLPLTPIIAIIAAAGVTIIMSLGPAGLLNAVGLAVIWIIAVPVRAMCYSTQRLNAWCWQGGISDREASQNLLLDAAGDTLRDICRGESLAIYGPLNQAYVLAGASWPTPIVTPEYYLDHIHPTWQHEHNVRLIASPPTWLLDTGNCLDAKALRTGLGLDYCCRYRFGSTLRLYKLATISTPILPIADVATYRMQTRAELFAEEVRTGDEFVVHDFDDDAYTQDDFLGDTTAAALSELLQDLAGRGYRKLAVYGAGRFTLRHADLYRNSDAPISVVLDDNGELDGGTCAEWPIRSLDKVSPNDFDAIIISTDRFARAMVGRIRRRFGHDIPTFTIDV